MNSKTPTFVIFSVTVRAGIHPALDGAADCSLPDTRNTSIIPRIYVLYSVVPWCCTLLYFIWFSLRPSWLGKCWMDFLGLPLSEFIFKLQSLIYMPHGFKWNRVFLPTEWTLVLRMISGINTGYFHIQRYQVLSQGSGKGYFHFSKAPRLSLGPVQPPIRCVLSWGWSGRNVTLTAQQNLAPRLRKSGAVPMLLVYAFMAWSRLLGFRSYLYLPKYTASEDSDWYTGLCEICVFMVFLR